MPSRCAEAATDLTVALHVVLVSWTPGAGVMEGSVYTSCVATTLGAVSSFHASSSLSWTAKQLAHSHSNILVVTAGFPLNGAVHPQRHQGQVGAAVAV